MRYIDVAVISATLWLLASLVLDIFTPKSITFFMIAAALAPSVLIGLGVHFRREHVKAKQRSDQPSRWDEHFRK
ncbi:hypothetical protein [Bradyrhizobium lablabi]|uniref:hypothetical protein n=1 Tax=Bradyrhizobium lablabi TaxID=722472 RepID=UPI001BA6AF49|nr:hypothetical protein [Bradyrhizobium lablabi]MBR0691803.1 hypothetical protein [Bradyrhizobium lablabi]